MSNKYLEKIALFVRPKANLISRAKALTEGIAKRERSVNMGLSDKPTPFRANLKSQVLNNQIKNKMWTSPQA